MKLVIVESPTKAKTIKRFLGKNYKVMSSYGHIRDLPKNDLGIDEKKFKLSYAIPPKALKTVNNLQKEARKADEIILATDEDREGEAIAWHIKKALKLKKGTDIQRIVFHEITKKAILDALKNPRKINMQLVDAQQARRVLDRLVGYKLSPLLWSKIAWGLSAGRVQSVAVKLICEREKEIKNFKPVEYWKIFTTLLNSQKESFEADLTKKKSKKIEKLTIKEEKEALQIKRDLEKATYIIKNLQKKQILKNPYPPYTTSSLQQDAANRLYFSTKKTMFLAQRLYEGAKLDKKKSVGLITYMRTDSLNLSNNFLNQAQKYLKEKLQEKNITGPRRFKTKSKGAQEAHEAIRPTDVLQTPQAIKKHLDKDMFRLYELIWQRAVASQMNPAVFESTKAVIKTKDNQYELTAQGKIKKSPGFTKIYPLKDQDNLLPELKENEDLELKKVTADQKFTNPPARYTEAKLVKTLEKYGIGRPSTYAPIISTIQKRKYVEKNDDKKFVPTEIGSLINDFLQKHFSQIVDYDFTANMEEDLDKIALGKKEWQPIIKDFYTPFSKKIQLKKEKVKNKEEKRKKLKRKCPLCGHPLVEKFSRYGRFIACSNYPDCKYTENLNGKNKKDNKPKYSDKKCPLCGGRLVYRHGKYGQFLGCENYPKCRYIENSQAKTGISCPKCSKGELVQKRTKKGRIFYACDQYPECKFAIWGKPIKEKCPKCGSLLMKTGKDGKVIKCSNKLCDYKKK
jgi:DNA topoisomerase I